MITLPLAIELEVAGLKHKPEDGDLYWIEEAGTICIVNSGIVPEDGDYWLPSLDQLLAEIESRGWNWWISGWEDGPPDICPSRYYCHISKDSASWSVYGGTTSEDAAAKALLEILKEGVKQ